MRYMGDALLDVLNPMVKDEMVRQAATMPDDKARDLLDVSDATPYGKKQKMLRIGAGALGGVVVGLVLGKVFGR